jgi:hypothetical protein
MRTPAPGSPRRRSPPHRSPRPKASPRPRARRSESYLSSTASASGGGEFVTASEAWAAEGLEGAPASSADGLVANGRSHINSTRVIERGAAEPGPYHNFPGSFDQAILEQGEQKVSVGFFQKAKAGYGASGVQYTLPGSINGQAGVFEIGTRLSTSGNVELIMHRFFRPLP